MVVAPGFVDIHSHSDFTLLVDPRAQSQIYQGVTTELVGNCGHGCGPFVGDIERFKGNIYGYQDLLKIDWGSLGDYLDLLDELRPAVNVATLVPNGNLRIAAVDDVARPAMASETRDMARLLEAALDAGAFGLSTGLEYPPEHHASEEEIIELCRIVAARGGLYATHERERDLLAIEAVEEGIRASMASGVRLQLSHLIPRRRRSRRRPGGHDRARRGRGRRRARRAVRCTHTAPRHHQPQRLPAAVGARRRTGRPRRPDCVIRRRDAAS